MAGAEAQSPKAPTTRPAWLLLLSFVMVMSAVQIGMTGLDVLAGRTELPAPASVVMSLADVQVRVQRLAEGVARREHPTAVTAHAAAGVAVSLFLLFAVATVFARDPRGRAFAIGAGWLGMVHELGEVLYAVTVSRPALLAIGPQFFDEMARYAGKSSGDIEPAQFFAALEASTLIFPVIGAAFGILISGLIIAFFKGRRGRILYGIEPAPGGRA